MFKNLEAIQGKRRDAARWVAHNPILPQGFIGQELETDKIKVGDGVTHWNDLDYLGNSEASGPIRLIQTPWTFASLNIETTGFVVGALAAGEVLLQVLSRTTTVPDQATTVSLFADSASGEDFLNGGTLDLSKSEGAKLFALSEVADGNRGAHTACNIVMVMNATGNIQGAGTFFALVLTPT